MVKSIISKQVLLVQILFLVAVYSVAWAQTVPSPGRPGAVEKSLQPPPVQQPALLPEIIIQEEGTPRLDDGKITFQLKDLIFDEHMIYPPEQLKAVVAEYLGKTIAVGKLTEIADAITAFYTREGYFLTRAYIPPQSIKDGTVQIKVREGRLGDIIINGNKRYSRVLIRNTLKVIRGEGALRISDVERGLLLLTDIPGLKVKATFKPGSQPATSDIVIDVTEDRFVNYFLDYNNFGSRYVDKDRLGAAVDFYNPAGLGDIFSIRGTTAAKGPQNLFYGRFEYIAPIGYSGIKMGLNYHSLDYKLAGGMGLPEASGESKGGGLWLSYPILRGRMLNWYVQGGFEAKNVNMDLFSVEVGKDRIRHAYLGNTVQWNDIWEGSNTISLKGYQSFAKILGGADQGDKDVIRLGSEVIYNKVEIDAFRIQRLPNDFSLLLNFTSQWTGSRLPSSEQFNLGGAGSVRGYAQSERSGDSGLVATAEFRIPPPMKSSQFFRTGKKLGEVLQFAVFYDYGKIWISDPALHGEQALHGAYMHGLGAGLRVAYSPYLRMKVDWAKSVGGNTPDHSDDKNGVWYVQMAVSF